MLWISLRLHLIECTFTNMRITWNDPQCILKHIYQLYKYSVIGINIKMSVHIGYVNIINQMNKTTFKFTTFYNCQYSTKRSINKTYAGNMYFNALFKQSPSLSTWQGITAQLLSDLELVYILQIPILMSQ